MGRKEREEIKITRQIMVKRIEERDYVITNGSQLIQWGMNTHHSWSVIGPYKISGLSDDEQLVSAERIGIDAYGCQQKNLIICLFQITLNY